MFLKSGHVNIITYIPKYLDNDSKSQKLLPLLHRYWHKQGLGTASNLLLLLLLLYLFTFCMVRFNSNIMIFFKMSSLGVYLVSFLGLDRSLNTQLITADVDGATVH